jgi:hypothetical protein
VLGVLRRRVPPPPQQPAPDGPQPGDLDAAPPPPHPDVIVFGDWHPPAALGFAVREVTG